MISEDKKPLRTECRKIRDSIGNIDVLSSDISSLLFDTMQYKNADKVLIYWSTDSEVKTLHIIEKALQDGKQVALPKCTDRNGNMEFYYISSLSDLIEGMYGIMEPAGDRMADDFTANSICIVPALSFDQEGFRLGYGKGYYDRFLSKFCGISIGVCFETCMKDTLPRDKYDLKVNYIITETKIYDLR